MTVLKVLIGKYTGATKDYQYEARNINSFDQSLEVPVSVFGLPESPSDSAILTKADGNTEKLTFAWTIKEEDSSPLFDGNGAEITSFTRNSDSTLWNPLTPDGQQVAILEIFEKVGIGTNEKHRFQIWDDTNSKSIVDKYGVINRMAMQKNATDPVTWNATIEFTVGDDVTVSG